jgi:hypothetical protein
MREPSLRPNRMSRHRAIGMIRAGPNDLSNDVSRHDRRHPRPVRSAGGPAHGRPECSTSRACARSASTASSRRRASPRVSLYSTYGSKDQPTPAHLQGRSDSCQAQVAEALPAWWGNPRDRILGIFELTTE